MNFLYLQWYSQNRSKLIHSIITIICLRSRQLQIVSMYTGELLKRQWHLDADHFLYPISSYWTWDMQLVLCRPGLLLPWVGTMLALQPEFGLNFNLQVPKLLKISILLTLLVKNQFCSPSPSFLLHGSSSGILRMCPRKCSLHCLPSKAKSKLPNFHNHALIKFMDVLLLWIFVKVRF